MKSEKGITLATLLVYIAIMLVALVTLGTITAYFQSNINEFNTKSTQDIEFDKFNLYFIKEAKITNNAIDDVNSTSTKITFKSGNKYEFKDNSIILNDNIKIAENVGTCEFIWYTENNSQVIKVTMKIGETKRTNEYVLSNQVSEDTDGEDYIYGYRRVEGTSPLILENSVKTNLKDYKIYGNSIQDDTSTEIKSVGDKTINLFNPEKTGELIINNKYYGIDLSDIDSNFTVSIKLKEGKQIPNVTFGLTYIYTTSTSASAIWLTSRNVDDGMPTLNKTFASAPSNEVSSIGLGVYPATEENWNAVLDAFDIFIVEGTYTSSTMPEFEPYGKYKIPIKAGNKNLLNYTDIKTVKDTNFNGTLIKTDVSIPAGETITVSADVDATLAGSDTNAVSLVLTYEDDTTYTYNYWNPNCIKIPAGTKGRSYTSYVATKNVKQVTFTCHAFNESAGGTTIFSNYQLEVGSFEQYYTYINIYLDEPLRKVGNYADYIDFENQKLVRNVGVNEDGTYYELTTPTETEIELPLITANNNSTTFLVDTEVQPSNISVVYYSK